jgi:hypothetical protein
MEYAETPRNMDYSCLTQHLGFWVECHVLLGDVLKCAVGDHEICQSHALKILPVKSDATVKSGMQYVRNFFYGVELTPLYD